MHIRLKREECKHTKHDIVFSKWEILIGPNDWKDHASGKDGVERYRIHNLPNSSSCPGIYELGVAFIQANEGKRLRKLDHENIVVVYLGQADNIRTRLQEYGRSGSHLDHVNLDTNRKNYESTTGGGAGLFKNIFSNGHSIMFRWAPMRSKMQAEKTEIELLFIFDYAWNRRGNGECRHADILAKLYDNSRSTLRSTLRKLLQWKQQVPNKRVGIDIDEVAPLFEKEALPISGLKAYLIPRVFKLSSSQIHLLPGDDKNKSAADQIVCGVATGHGAICMNQPLPGRKRCGEHRGKKITGIGSQSKVSLSSQNNTSSSDIITVDGKKIVTSPFFDEAPLPCHQHWPRMSPEKLNYDEEEIGVCGVISGDGGVCRRRPSSGRKRCEEHKGKRLSVHNRSLELNTCGVINDDGHACSKLLVHGNKRCAEHKGKRIVAAANIMASR